LLWLFLDAFLGLKDKWDHADVPVFVTAMTSQKAS